MRQAIETAPRDGEVVILENEPTGTYDVARWSARRGEWVAEDGEPTKITPTHWCPTPGDKYLPEDHDESSKPTQLGPSSPRARPLITARLITGALIAAVLIRIYYLDSEQETLLQREDSRKTESMALRQRTEADQATVQARTQVAVLARQGVEASASQRRQSSEMEPPREDLVNELSEARRAIDGLDVQLRADAANSAQSLDQEPQKTAALAQEAAAARQELTTSAAKHRQALDEERARSDALAGELAAAQREIETQAAQLRKASEETGQLKQEDAANSAQSLEQERLKMAALAQEAAAARQELTTSTAKHRQALDVERARSAALAGELATAQREIETQAAQLKASEETGQLRQTEAANSAQSLDQERQKTAALAQEVAAARQELTTSTAKHRQALDIERAGSAALAGELATARREIETQAAQLKASEEAARPRQAEAANSAQSLDQERQKTTALAQEAAAARQELATSTAKHHQALDEERTRSAALAGALTAAQHENEMQAAQLRKASEETGQLRQETESSMKDLRQSLQQERDRTEAMARDIESARRTIDVRVAPEATVSSSLSKATQVIEAAAMAQPAAAEAQESPETTRLIARARALLGQGNISAARIVLERAAETGSALASFVLAETYDPVILSTWGTYGTRGDTAKARKFYSKAHAGGIQDAKDRLDELDQ
jgi:hypothetical protein